MKHIYLILSLISLVLFFSSCGGNREGTVEDRGGTTDGSDKVKIQKIQVSTCNTYTSIQNGDTLVKETDNTVVTIRDIDSLNKAVCINIGAAHILIKIKWKEYGESGALK